MPYINLQNFLVLVVVVMLFCIVCKKIRKKRRRRLRLKIDDFHCGRFHFEDKVQDDLISKIKYALAKNDQESLYHFLRQVDGACDKRDHKKRELRGDVITIGFFCNYMNSGIFRNTVGIYNDFFDKIKWVGCQISSDYAVIGVSCPVITFSSVESAIDYANRNFDFVIDADFLLRPKNFYEVLRKTSCYTLNYYNFSCSSYNNNLDAFLVTSGLEVSKYQPTEKVITLPAQGSWLLKEQEEFFPDYICDIMFIGDQFKYGQNFLKLYRNFSDEFKIIFLGLKDACYFSKHLREAGWNMKNIKFHKRIDEDNAFRYFLTKTKVVVDTPDYSGGSSTLYALRSGAPVLTLNGQYLLDGMTSSMVKEMGLGEMSFDSVEEMKNFIRSKSVQEMKGYSKYVAKKTSESLYFQPGKFLPIFYDELMKVFGREGDSKNVEL